MNDFSFYFSIGWEHIMTLEALDHILFIAALAAIYLLKDWKQVLILVTAFTVGHTITLFLSAKELVNVKVEIIEFLVPCTIAITAITNLFQKSFTPKAIRINYLLALFFGLIHGLAFATTLRMILATNQSFALSMFSFSLGLEAGQILVVLVILLLSQGLVSGLRVERRHWVIFLSAAVFSLAVQMAAERWPWKGEEPRISYLHRNDCTRENPFYKYFLANRQHRPVRSPVATLCSTTVTGSNNHLSI